MSELMNDSDLPTLEAEDEAPVQYFCKFTFAQFFTIMILAVFTLGFMFYLGARYGNDYLRLGQVENSVTSAPISTFSSASSDPEKASEMLATAREALQQQQAEKLQGQVANVLQNPSAYQQVQELQQQPGVVSVYSQQQQQQQQQQQAVAPMAAPVPQPTVPTTTVQTNTNPRLNDYEPSMNQPPVQQQQPQVVYPQQQQQAQALPEPQPIPESPSADEDETVATVPAKSTGPAGTFSVQVAASQDMTEANQWVQGWRDKGYSAYMMAADIPSKGRWYRVRLGTFPSRETAEVFASQLKEKEQVQAIAVQNE